MSNFRVGQKVVCLHDHWVGEGWQTDNEICCPLLEGVVYTVRTICPVVGVGLSGEYKEHVGVILEEVDHPLGLAFDASRFRPATERGTEKGMSILRDLLDKADQPIEVVA